MSTSLDPNAMARTIALTLCALGSMIVFTMHSRHAMEAAVDAEMRRVCPCLQAVTLKDE